jgi:hypothetical protein
MNTLVVAANHGQMPVLSSQCTPDMFDDTIHGCMNAASHLKFLADWIVVPGVGVASPGDFFIWAYQGTVVPAIAAWFVLVVKDHNAVLKD